MDILSYKMGQNSIEPDKPDQDKTANPSTSTQVIKADSGYELASVTINPVTSSIDDNIKQENIKAGITILGVQGNVEPDKPDQTKTVNPSTLSQTIEPDVGYELASVTINPVTASIDSNITASNIKKNVSILGVTGSFEPDTGAYQVSSIEEMNQLTNMKNGDYCVIKGVPTYVMPGLNEEVTFSRFSGEPQDLLNGVYDNCLFLFSLEEYSSNNLLSTNEVSYGDNACRTYDKLIPRNDNSYTFNIYSYKHLVFRRQILNDNHPYLVDLNNYTFKSKSSNSSWIRKVYKDNITGNYLSNITKTTSNNRYKLYCYYSNGNSKIGSSSTTSSDGYSGNLMNFGGTWSDFNIYYYRLSTATVDHLVYKYNGTTWVDVTDDILVPTTNVTPTTSAQTLSIPTGYRGFKTVNVSGVNNTIDQNIVNTNIKKDVTILGVTGTYEGGSTGAYRVSSVTEMNAITGMQQYDVCVVVTGGTVVLPAGYSGVEYIQATGTQYINTGLKGKNNISIDADYSIVELTNWSCLLGAANSINTPTIGCVFGITNNGSISGGWYWRNTTNEQFTGNNIAQLNVKTNLKTTPTSFVFKNANGTKSYSFSTVDTFQTNGDMYIFAGNKNGTVNDYSKIKLYSMKIYDDSTLVRDYVPAIRESDNKAGLYDKANDVFYVNSGSDNFTVGSSTGIILETYVYDTNDGWVAV